MGFFDTGCNNISEGASGNEKNPAGASSEKLFQRAETDPTFFHAKLGNQEHHRMHNSGLLSRIQHSEVHLTYKGPGYGDFQTCHSLYTTILVKTQGQAPPKREVLSPRAQVVF